MSRPRWTLLLVPHDNERVRSVQVTGSAVRAALSLFLLLLLLGGTFSIGFFVEQSHQLRATLLARENRLLAAEVQQMRAQMETLNDTLALLARKDEKFRLIAGLEAAEAAEAAPRDTPAPVSAESAALAALSPAVGREVEAASSDLGTLLSRARRLSTSLDRSFATLQANRQRLAATPSIAPSEGALSSLFSRGRRHPVLRITRPHKGIDIAAPVGEPILAPAGGRVRFASFKSGGYGNVVEIDHGYGHVTRYAHASRVLVRRGQVVRRGDTIAEVGATGLVSGPHLHYEVEHNGEQVDPLNFIIADEIPD